MELRKEVLPMTRSEAIKAFFFKSVLPVIVALILYCIFKSACMKNGELDYVWLWILCGLPFGLHRMCLWIVPGGGSLGGGIALFASCRWKSHSQPDGKRQAFSTGLQTAFPQPRNSGSLRTFPQRLLRRLSILSYPILKKYYGNPSLTEVQFVPCLLYTSDAADE